MAEPDGARVGAPFVERHPGAGVGEDPSSGPVARLEHDHVLARADQGVGRCEARNAGPDDDDVEIGGGGGMDEAGSQGAGQEGTSAEPHCRAIVCYRAGVLDGIVRPPLPAFPPSGGEDGSAMMTPSLLATARGALWLGADGEIERLSGPDAGLRAAATLPLVVHAPATAARLGLNSLAARDLLELYAFVRPASFCLPTPRGLAAALDIFGDDELTLLPRIGDALIDALEDMAAFASPEMKAIATAMARGNWAWGSEVLAALGLDQTRHNPAGDKPRPNFRPGAGLDVWKSLPAWEEPPPATPPGSQPVEPREARLRLAQRSRPAQIAEARPTQGDYASAAGGAFAPREAEGKPQVVLAEAGTGIGKTLGYLAPASLWARRNGAPVWVSTYTRNLQRQIDQELRRLYPIPTSSGAAS